MLGSILNGDAAQKKGKLVQTGFLVWECVHFHCDLSVTTQELVGLV